MTQQHAYDLVAGNRFLFVPEDQEGVWVTVLDLTVNGLGSGRTSLTCDVITDDGARMDATLPMLAQVEVAEVFPHEAFAILDTVRAAAVAALQVDHMNGFWRNLLLQVVNEANARRTRMTPVDCAYCPGDYAESGHGPGCPNNPPRR